jgi:hypothetical protein
MSGTRTLAQRKTDVLDALARNGDIWLATASPDGGAHLIAASAWWNGSEIVIATIGTSRTARNLDTTGGARLALGSPEDVTMIDASVIATTAVADSDAELHSGFAAAVGWDPADEPGPWRFFRLRPRRIQAYRGYGEREGRDVMRGARWSE